MNMSRCSARRRKHCHQNPKVRFYQKLKSYLKVLFVLFTLGVFLDNDFFDLFSLVALIGGISLGLKAIKINGVPGTKGWLSDDWFDWIKHRYEEEPTNISNNFSAKEEGEDYDPIWKDKDLV